MNDFNNNGYMISYKDMNDYKFMLVDSIQELIYILEKFKTEYELIGIMQTSKVPELITK